MLTRNNIEYDLSKSEFTAKVQGHTFFFTSRLHLTKFLKRLEEHTKELNESLSNRFNLYLDMRLLSALVLYRKIEKRGFLIANESGVRILCVEMAIFAGGTVTNRN